MNLRQHVRLRILAWLWLAALGAPRDLHAHGDLHARIDALTAEIRQKPDQPDLFLQRAELHRMHEDWALAEADYDRAEKLDPQLAAVWLGRSRLLLSRQQFKVAQAEVERFLTRYPKHTLALSVRAHALSGQKRFLDAAETWSRVIDAAASPDVEHYYERARALAAAGPKHTAAALRALDDGLAKLGNVPTLGLYAIELEVAAKRYDAALDRIDRLMPKTDRKETWRELRGDTLAKAGKQSEAQEEYARALEEMTALPARIRSTKAGAALEQRLRSKVKR